MKQNYRYRHCSCFNVDICLVKQRSSSAVASAVRVVVGVVAAVVYYHHDLGVPRLPDQRNLLRHQRVVASSM